jgi:hypothetical protein
MKDTEAEFLAEQDARTAAVTMEEDIRKAQAVSYGGAYHKAVEVFASGMQIIVYTNVDGDTDPEVVTYKLQNNQLKRGEAELGTTPTEWITLASKIRNNLLSPAVPIFTIVNKTVKINLIVTDEKDRLNDRPVSVNTLVTVRSKGAME